MEKYDPYLIAIIRSFTGSKFDPDNKIWITDLINKDELDKIFSTSFYDYIFSKE